MSLILEILFKSSYSLHSNINERDKKGHCKHSAFCHVFNASNAVLLQNFTGCLLQAARELLVIISLVFA